MLSSECGHSACGEGCDCAQEFGELVCGAWIEAAISAVGEFCDIPERLFDFTIVSFLEHECWDLELSEFAGFMGECIGIFLHGVADEDQGADLKQFSFLLGVGEDLTYLGFPGRAHDLRHVLAS